MLVLISLYYSIDHKYKWSIVFAIVSVYFHRLALLPCMIILYLSLFRPKNNYLLSKKETAILVVIGLIGSLASRKLVELIAAKWSFFSRINLYMTKDVGYDSLVIWVGYELFLIIAIYFLGFESIIKNRWIDLKTKEAVNILFRFMLFGITISGFMLFVEEFNRMYRLFYLQWTMIIVSMLFMAVAMMRGINFDLYW